MSAMNKTKRNTAIKRQALAACFQVLPYCVKQTKHNFQLERKINGLTNFSKFGKPVAISVVGKINFIIECETTERNQAYLIR